MSSDRTDDLPRSRAAARLLPAALRDAAARLPFATTSAAPRPGDTVDLAAVLAAGRDTPDLSHLGPALAAALGPLPAAAPTPDTALREAQVTPADLPRPGWVEGSCPSAGPEA